MSLYFWTTFRSRPELLLSGCDDLEQRIKDSWTATVNVKLMQMINEKICIRNQQEKNISTEVVQHLRNRGELEDMVDRLW